MMKSHPPTFSQTSYLPCVFYLGKWYAICQVSDAKNPEVIFYLLHPRVHMCMCVYICIIHSEYIVCVHMHVMDAHVHLHLWVRVYMHTCGVHGHLHMCVFVYLS